MFTCVRSVSRALCLALVLICLAMAGPVFAQGSKPSQKTGGQTVGSFRAQYATMMANFARIYAATGDTAGQERVRQGLDAMGALTDNQLARLYAQSRIPDLAAAAAASEYVASHVQSVGGRVTDSLPFPDAPDLINECKVLPIDSASRFALLILKEIANGILAAAAFVCQEDILGENASLGCVPLAIASDLANGVFDSAQYCAGEFTANQVDANFNRLAHIHDDLTAGIKTVTTNNNTNRTLIINNDNANRTLIINNDTLIKDAIISNDNVNKNAIISNDNVNKNAIINNDKANKDAIFAELRRVCGR
jgi:hypothetical protein